MTTSEVVKSITYATHPCPPMYLATASTAVLTTRDTSRIKTTANTIAMENNRSRTESQIVRSGLGLTSQIVLSESCNSTKTPEAVKSRMTELMTSASVPDPDLA